MAARKKAKHVRVIHTQKLSEYDLTGKIEDVISFLQNLKASMEKDGKTDISVNIESQLDSDYGYGGAQIPCARLDVFVYYKFKGKE